ncbi:MAG: amidohydrolase family protein [Pseudohongiellaceae bacterium]
MNPLHILTRGLLVTLLVAPAFAFADDLVVRAERLMTGTGETIDDGVVVIEDGRITAVGPAASVRIPDDMPVRRAAVATPGLVDGRSVVGLAGALNQNHDQDQLERSAALQPELRAIDAYNPRETLVEWLREHGVTTVHTGHGPGEVISGQTLIAKTRGETIDEAVFVPFAAVAATLGDGALVDGEPRNSPGTRAKAVAMLRAKLIEAQEYLAKQDAEEPPARNLALESLVAVLRGEVPLMVEANRHQDIVTALRLAEEFDFRLLLTGAADATLVLDEIVAADVPVIIHPIMIRGSVHGERQNVSFTTPAELLEAGVATSLQSGYEGYVPKTRVVLFEAALGLGYGLSPEQALELVTMGPARILGIDERVGSLEVGKDGDVALFDGDPFEYTSHVVGVVIEGEVVSETVR